MSESILILDLRASSPASGSSGSSRAMGSEDCTVLFCFRYVPQLLFITPRVSIPPVGNMEKRAVKLWMFDREDFSYWKSWTKAYLLSQECAIWEIVEQDFAIPDDLNTAPNRLYKKGKNSKKFTKAIARACVADLSDVDLRSSEGLTSSEEEAEKAQVRRKEDFTGLCFMAKNDHDTDSGSDSNTSEVPPTLDELSSELDHLRDVLLMQDDKLHRAVHESRELKSKLESADFEIASLRSKLARDDIVVECESCRVVMNDLIQRESVHAQVASQLESALKEFDEFKARPTLLGACLKCPMLTDELEAQSLKVKELESMLQNETRSKAFPPPCEVCVSLQGQAS
ncbi:hypothetical protein PR202_ga12755 [Eleusine coracana subsp. coracana]|uniref:Uncharacterized protein n=1 Tax=Eleusine coracana subsp. coracana TaxID=191504 RepID=A0AAV5CCY4_ELECO|nr:hypothetical protein PR202_ga12755 [Eleusine coracana subsp. coracana]